MPAWEAVRVLVATPEPRVSRSETPLIGREDESAC